MTLIRWALLRWMDYFKEITKCVQGEIKRNGPLSILD